MRLWWNWQRSLRSLQRQSRCCRICRADRLTALWTNPQPRSVSANMDSGAYLKNQYHAPVVELADTLDLGSSARAWGFKSLKAHQKDRKVFFITIRGLEPNVHYVRSYAFGYAVRFFSELLYSSSEKKAKGHCVREKAQWAFEQQCVQGRME